jgi:hypothetical protein
MARVIFGCFDSSTLMSLASFGAGGLFPMITSILILRGGCCAHKKEMETIKRDNNRTIFFIIDF